MTDIDDSSDEIAQAEYYISEGDCAKHTKYVLLGIPAFFALSQLAVTIGWATSIPNEVRHGNPLAYSYARIYKFPEILLYWLIGTCALIIFGMLLFPLHWFLTWVYMIFAAISRRAKKRYMSGYEEIPAQLSTQTNVQTNVLTDVLADAQEV